MILQAQSVTVGRFAVGCLVGATAFLRAGTDADGAAVGSIGLAFIIAFALEGAGVGGSAASSVQLDAGELVARFAFRHDERIPLREIAGVEVRRSFWRSRTFETIALLRIFRRDMPAVIELRASEKEADAFLVALAQHARRLGVTSVAPFAIPRRHYVHDLAPLVAAIPIIVMFPWRISWPSLGIAVAAFVIHSLFTWSAMRELGRAPEALAEWKKLLSNVRAS